MTNRKNDKLKCNDIFLSFLNQPINSDSKTYENIRKLSTG